LKIRDRAREQITDHYLFSAMPRAEIDSIMTSLRVIRLDMEEILFNHDDPATHFFFMGDGKVKLSRISPTGHEKVVNVLQAGSCFAEAVMFMEQESYPVTAQALAKSTVFGINCETYKSILKQNPVASFRLINDLSNRLQLMLREIEILSVQNATHRVAHYFLDQLSPDASQEVTLQLDTSKSLLASRLSVEPETLSRIFHKLTNSGAIAVRGRSITVKDRSILRDFA
jgi:CRP-like cAMP-binding protein